METIVVALIVILFPILLSLGYVRFATWGKRQKKEEKVSTRPDWMISEDDPTAFRQRNGRVRGRRKAPLEPPPTFRQPAAPPPPAVSVQSPPPKQEEIKRPVRPRVATGPDYYALIGVGPDATAEEIERAYRRAAARIHPDQYFDDPEARARAEQKLKELNNAMAVLRDPRRRAVYDSRF